MKEWTLTTIQYNKLMQAQDRIEVARKELQEAEQAALLVNELVFDALDIAADSRVQFDKAARVLRAIQIPAAETGELKVAE